MSKQAKAVKPTIVLSADLVTIAKKIGTQVKGANKVALELGKLTVQAAPMLSAESLDAFIATCKTACGDAPEATVKVYMSNVRGVLRAMFDGYVPADGVSIKAMYADAPKGKGQNTGNTTGARTVKGKDQSGKKEPEAVARPMSMADVALFMFGHSDDELVAALTWASKNEASLIRYVKANAEAAAKPATKLAAVKGNAKPRKAPAVPVAPVEQIKMAM